MLLLSEEGESRVLRKIANALTVVSRFAESLTMRIFAGW